MAVPAVIRVKRSRDESPLEALVISCKRQRCIEEVSLTTVLTFAGTVKNQDENVQCQLSQALKEVRSQATYKSHVPHIKEKVREQIRSQWQKDRFKVVNFYRFQGDVEGNAGVDFTSEELTVLDIESHHASEVYGDGGEIASGSCEAYEYDLYYTESAADLTPGVMDTLLSIHPYEMADESYREDELGDDYSDDSNDENNWRNDYPEERSDDEDDSQCRPRGVNVDEDDDLLKQMATCGIGSGEELSDDEDDEALVYGRSESPFEEYKRRCGLQLGEDSANSESDEHYSGHEEPSDED